jgi:hypothetical protein
MNDTIAARDEVLSRLVDLKNTHADMMVRQAERLDGIVINDVPSMDFVKAEQEVMARLSELVSDFAQLAEGFPVFIGRPGVVVDRFEEKTRWFGFRKNHEIMREAESPDLPEARLQDARLDHILESLGGDLAKRRLALQHASYTIKRAVVGLNRAAAYSLEDGGTRLIERERHALETLVSVVDRVILEIVVSIRRLEGIAAQRDKVEQPGDAAASDLPTENALMLAG